MGGNDRNDGSGPIIVAARYSFPPGLSRTRGNAGNPYDGYYGECYMRGGGVDGMETMPAEEVPED